jgi:hypothetical protein
VEGPISARSLITSPLWQQAGDSLADTIRTGHPDTLNGEAPHLNGILAERPDVAARAERHLTEHGLARGRLPVAGAVRHRG